MDRNEFIQSLQEIVLDEILITEYNNNLKKEIAQNCWSISMNEEIAKQLKVHDIQDVLEKIKLNRRNQLNLSPINIDLIYYSWIDIEAGQLRFNLINSRHKKLPFNSNIKIIDKEEKLINDYLKIVLNNERKIDDLAKVYREEIEKEKTRA